MSRPDGSAFIDRSAEIGQLQAALAAAAEGDGRLVVVAGEAGIGRTSLIEAFVREAADRGSIVLVGGSPAYAGSDLPFAALVEALRGLPRALDTHSLEEVLGAARPVVARLVPSLALPGEPAPEVGPESAQTRLFEAILGVLERLGDGPAPAVLVLEDLHWADASTRELLAFLARNVRTTSVLVVATYRTDAVPGGHPLRLLLAELERSDRVGRIDLPRFDRDAARAQISSLLGREPEDALVDEVYGRSDGNPLFVAELTAAATGRGEGGLPETLRELLLSRLAPLGDGAQDVLRMAAVAGRRFDPRLIGAVTGLDEATLITVLREAVRHHLLVPVRDEAGEGFAFRHGLLREAVYEDIVPGERSRRHALVASVFAAYPELLGPTSFPDAEIARHWVAAGIPERALPALVRAGMAAEAAYAFPEAARAYGAALSAWDRAAVGRRRDGRVERRQPIGFRVRTGSTQIGTTETPPLSRTEVLARAAEAEALAGAPEMAVKHARAVVEEAESKGGARLALATERLARYLDEDGQFEAAMAAYERAVELAQALPPSPDPVRVLGSHARALVGAGRYEEARALCERAIALGEAAEAPSEVRRIRNTYGVALAFLGDIEVGLEQLRAARARVVERTAASVVRPRPSRISEVVRGYADLAALLGRAGRADEVADVLMEGARLARELGVQATWGNTLEIHGALGRFQLGEWDEADRMTRRLLNARVRGPAAAWLHLVRVRLEMGRGSFDDAAVHLEAAHVVVPTTADPTLVGELAATTAELALWRGRLTDARTAVDEALSRLHAGQDQLPVVRLCWLGIRAEAERATVARVRRAPGELAEAIETAGALRAEAIAVERTLEPRARLAPRELRLYPALVDAEWGRATDTDDPERWAVARDRAAELRDPWLSAYAGWREAEARLADRGTRGQAEDALRRAFESATELGALPILGEIEALARRGRIDLTPDAPEQPTPARPADRFGLTTRELEVLALVAEGRTNRQIADELFITEKTAGHHVSNLLAKLDAATRVEAAAIAHRLGLIEPFLAQERSGEN